MEIVSFRDLDAWNVAMELVVTTYELVSKLPASERFELSAQMRRAAVSIPSNVAEGHACRGRRFMHHVRIGLGSLAELDTQLEVAQRLGMLAPHTLDGVTGQIARTGQVLHGLLRSLRRNQLKQAAIGCAGFAVALCLLYV